MVADCMLPGSVNTNCHRFCVNFRISQDDVNRPGYVTRVQWGRPLGVQQPADPRTTMTRRCPLAPWTAQQLRRSWTPCSESLLAPLWPHLRGRSAWKPSHRSLIRCAAGVKHSMNTWVHFTYLEMIIPSVAGAVA